MNSPTYGNCFLIVSYLSVVQSVRKNFNWNFVVPKTSLAKNISKKHWIVLVCPRFVCTQSHAPTINFVEKIAIQFGGFSLVQPRTKVKNMKIFQNFNCNICNNTGAEMIWGAIIFNYKNNFIAKVFYCSQLKVWSNLFVSLQL